MMDFGASDQPLHFSWRIVRWCAIGLFVPLALSATVLFAVVWRLAQTPLDVTSIAAHWQPIPLNMGEQKRPIGHVQWQSVVLGWTPHTHHVPAGMVLRAEHVELVQADGRVMDRLDHVAAVLSLASLLRGHIAFRAVNVSGASFTLKRYEDGTIGPDLVGFDHAPSKAQHAQFPSFLDLDALRDLEVNHLSVAMTDVQRPSDVMHFHMPLLMVHYQNETGWNGRLEGAFHWGKDDVPFQLMVEHGQYDRTHVVLTIDSFVPARLAGWVPILRAKELARWQFPVRMRAEGDVQHKGMGGIPLNLSTSFSFGRGDILQPTHDPLHVQEGSAHFALRWHGTEPLQDVTLEEGKIRLIMRDVQDHPVTVLASSRVHIDDLLRPEVVDVDVQAHMPSFDFATLGSVWPYGVMKGARRWMTENMTEGHGDTLAINAHLHSHSGLDDLVVSRLEGQLSGHAITVHWLRPVQPVTGLEANAHFVNPDTLQIDVSRGHLSDGHHASIAVPKGVITLSGLLHKDQYAKISLGLEGSFPSFLNVLAHPRLHLLSENALGLRSPAGDVHGTFSVGLPLDKDVDTRDITFGANAQCRNISFDSPDFGIVQHGYGQLQVMQHDIRFDGKASIRGIPVDMSVVDSFLANEPGRVLRTMKAHTWIDAALLGKMGIVVPAGIMTGAAQVAVDYVQKGLGHAHRQADVHVNIDLTPVAFATPMWMKKAGSASALDGRFRMVDAHIDALTHLTGYGPALALSGSGIVKNNHVSGVDFSHVKVGRTEGRFQAQWPVGRKEIAPYRVNIAAQTLDLKPWLQAKSGSSTIVSGSEPKHHVSFVLPVGEWHVSLQADRMMYDNDHAMTGIIGDASWRNYRLTQAHIKAAGPHPLSASIEPVLGKIRTHRLNADVSNLGALISASGAYKQLEGGQMRVTGLFTHKGATQELSPRWGVGLGTFQGRMEAHHLALAHPPAVLTAATVLAPLHWGEIERDRFEDMTGSASIGVDRGVMTITDGQLSNAILGATVEGTLDSSLETIALKGTISPLFKLNHAAGSMFGMRSILAPEKGSGVMALTYSLKGTFDKPIFQTDPLSVFLPGMLRHILQ